MATKKTIAKPRQRISKNDSVRPKAYALLLQGHTPSYVAEEVGVSVDTVKYWKKTLMPTITASMREEWAQEIERNLYRTILMAQLAMMKQLEVMSDEEWIRKQTAHDLAILHGVTHDKGIRLLEATTRGQDADEIGGGEG